MKLNDYADKVHTANLKWWLDLNNPCMMCGSTGKVIGVTCGVCKGFGYPKIERNLGEMLMLAVSELAEALEGHRKNLPDDKLPQFKMFDVEIIDCFIRLFDTCNGLGIDLVNPPWGRSLNEYRDYHLRFNHTLGTNVGSQLLAVTGWITRAYMDESSLMGHMLNAAMQTLFTIAAIHEIDIDTIFNAKMEYNAKRKDHTLEHRMSEHGKRY